MSVPLSILPPPLTCFVITTMDGRFDKWYHGVFKPAIESVGMLARRGDEEGRYSAPVMDHVLRGIREAAVVLAVLSAREEDRLRMFSPNVYYEVGFAHAIGKAVVFVCDEIDVPRIPFDVRHYRYLSYNKSDHDWGPQLGERLKDALRLELEDVKRGASGL